MKHIYVIGDSISAHYGPYLAQYLEGVCTYSHRESDASIDPDKLQDANSRDSTAVLDFLRAKKESGGIDADLVLLNCGLHDIKTDPGTGEKDVPLNQYRENLRSIIETVGKCVDLIWVRSTPCDEEVHNRLGMAFHRFAKDCEVYNAAADEIMASREIPVVDLFTFTNNLGEDIYCDHVHFHKHVRQKQAAFIAGWLACW